MKRVIRSRTTGFYLLEDGTWSTDAGRAYHFPGVSQAIEAQHRYALRDCDLVLQMGPEPSAEYDVVLPLNSVKPYPNVKSSPPSPEQDSGASDLRDTA